MWRFGVQVRRTVGAAAAVVVLAVPSAAGAAVPAGNLIQNPGADDAVGETDSNGAAIPQWQTIGRLSAVKYGAADGFPTVMDGMSIGGGANFFSGGINDTTSIGEQTIDVSASASEIDAGRTSVTLSAYLGGRLTDGDNATVTASFEDDPRVSDRVFGTLVIGPVTAADRGNQTTLLPRSTTADVPGGTRRIRVTITATRTAGQHNNGYADNLSLSLDLEPTAVNDTATVTEDAAPTAVNVLANDTDTDGGPKQVASVTQPAHGTVAITGGGNGLTYKPNANYYCNTQPGGAVDTFTYTLNGGSRATVAVPVTCVDDPPVTVNDTTTVAINSSTTAIDVLANDTDVDGGPKQITSVTQPAHGSVAITGGGTALTYKPSANYCNTQAGGSADTFTYTLNGGSNATIAVSVRCVQSTLTVTKSGPGAGTVTGPGIDCGGAGHIDCSETVTNGATMVLTASPAGGSTFGGFSGGGCRATSPCTVTLDADKTVDARFALRPSDPPGFGGVCRQIRQVRAQVVAVFNTLIARFPFLAGQRDNYLRRLDALLARFGCAPAAKAARATRPKIPGLQVGTARGDHLRGAKGDDVQLGLGGNDRLVGRRGRDLLLGARGNDRLNGGPGADIIFGGPAKDVLTGGPGSDLIVGEAGNDTINARDGTRDYVVCGGGRDSVTGDKHDVIARDCEHTTRR